MVVYHNLCIGTGGNHGGSASRRRVEIPKAPNIERQKASMAWGHGGMSPPQPTRVCGSLISSDPQRGSGRSPGCKRISVNFSCENAPGCSIFYCTKLLWKGSHDHLISDNIWSRDKIVHEQNDTFAPAVPRLTGHFPAAPVESAPM